MLAARVRYVLKTPTSCQWKSLIAVLPKSRQEINTATAQRKLIVQKIREIRVHMSTNLSSSSGFKLQSSLTEEQRNLWSNQLFEVFPEELRALLKRLCEITVSECQRIATTKLFHLFSFNASI